MTYSLCPLSPPLVDTALVRQSSGGTISWYLPDRLGTIRDLVNNAGAIIDHVDYSAFGTALDESSPSNGDRMMGFAGMERDTVTGLNLAVHRVENPTMGRWMSRDPLGFNAWDADLYRYVGNEPTGALDPSGLLREGFWWGLAQGGANLGNSATDVGIGILNTPGFVWNSTAGWILPNIPYIKAPDWSKGYFIDEDPLDRAISRGAGDVAVSCALFAGPFKRFLPRAGIEEGCALPIGIPTHPRARVPHLDHPRLRAHNLQRSTGRVRTAGRRLPHHLPVVDSPDLHSSTAEELRGSCRFPLRNAGLTVGRPGA